jgi:trimeric autotransporter adhesin
MLHDIFSSSAQAFQGAAAQSEDMSRDAQGRLSQGLEDLMVAENDALDACSGHCQQVAASARAVQLAAEQQEQEQGGAQQQQQPQQQQKNNILHSKSSNASPSPARVGQGKGLSTPSTPNRGTRDSNGSSSRSVGRSPGPSAPSASSTTPADAGGEAEHEEQLASLLRSTASRRTHLSAVITSMLGDVALAARSNDAELSKTEGAAEGLLDNIHRAAISMDAAAVQSTDLLDGHLERQTQELLHDLQVHFRSLQGKSELHVGDIDAAQKLSETHRENLVKLIKNAASEVRAATPRSSSSGSSLGKSGLGSGMGQGSGSGLGAVEVSAAGLSVSPAGVVHRSNRSSSIGSNASSASGASTGGGAGGVGGVGGGGAVRYSPSKSLGASASVTVSSPSPSPSASSANSNSNTNNTNTNANSHVVPGNSPPSSGDALIEKRSPKSVSVSPSSTSGAGAVIAAPARPLEVAKEEARARLQYLTAKRQQQHAGATTSTTSTTSTTTVAATALGSAGKSTGTSAGAGTGAGTSTGQ